MKRLDCEERLKNMRVIDNKVSPDQIVRVVKAELYYVLKNYLEIVSDDIELSIDINENGRYKLKLTCESNAIKAVKYI